MIRIELAEYHASSAEAASERRESPRLLSSISSDAFAASFAEIFHPGIAHDGDNGRASSQLFG
jgi:hypothetical protein